MRDPRPGLPWSGARVAERRKYGDYMISRAWFRRREAWLEAWLAAHGENPTCRVCDAPWTLRRGDLHHRTYARLGEERPEDLVALCRPCHTELHRLLEGAPGWRRLPREQGTDALIAVLRRHLIETERTANHE